MLDQASAPSKSSGRSRMASQMRVRPTTFGWAVGPQITRRCGSRTGSDRSSRLSRIENIAVLAPIPSASDRMATAETIGRRPHRAECIDGFRACSCSTGIRLWLVRGNAHHSSNVAGGLIVSNLGLRRGVDSDRHGKEDELEARRRVLGAPDGVHRGWRSGRCQPAPRRRSFHCRRRERRDRAWRDR